MELDDDIRQALAPVSISRSTKRLKIDRAALAPEVRAKVEAHFAALGGEWELDGKACRFRVPYLTALGRAVIASIKNRP